MILSFPVETILTVMARRRRVGNALSVWFGIHYIVRALSIPQKEQNVQRSTSVCSASFTGPNHQKRPGAGFTLELLERPIRGLMVFSPWHSIPVHQPAPSVDMQDHRLGASTEAVLVSSIGYIERDVRAAFLQSPTVP